MLLLAVAVGAAPLEPLVGGWERYFRLEWQAAESSGRPVVRGVLTNDSPSTIIRVTLLVDSLDQAGNVVAQHARPIPGTLPAFTGMPFEVAAPQPSARFRVRVFSFDAFRGM
ncbi:MAG: hypothetical protein ACRDH5_08710 [bacterium]